VPLPFAPWGRHPTRSQKPGDAARCLTVQEALVDAVDDFSFLRDDLGGAVGALAVAEEVTVSYVILIPYFVSVVVFVVAIQCPFWLAFAAGNNGGKTATGAIISKKTGFCQSRAGENCSPTSGWWNDRPKMKRAGLAVIGQACCFV